MKPGFHLKLGIGILLVFGLLLLGYVLWLPVQVKWHSTKFQSDDVTVRVEAVNGLISLGEPGIKELKAIFPDGPEAVDLLVEFWNDIDKSINRKRALLLLEKEPCWEVYPNSDYITVNYLHVASYKGYLESVKLLIEKGAGLNSYTAVATTRSKGGGKSFWKDYWKTSEGTPLHAASLSGRHRIVEYMLARGAHVNTSDSYGQTPLHFATRNNHKSTVVLLISKDAYINAIITGGSDKGKTALDIAIERGHKETTKLLRSHGAKTAVELKAMQK